MWTSPETRTGFGWILKIPDGQLLLKEYASIDPTEPPLKAEAIALKKAIDQVKIWGFQMVMFCGDAMEIYRKFSNLHIINIEEAWQHHHLITHLKDICFLAKSEFCYDFKYIRRTENMEADALGKFARSTS